MKLHTRRFIQFLTLALLAAVAFAPALLAQEKAGDAAKETAVVPAGVKLAPQMPGPSAPRPFQFPKAATKTLTNGVQVFVVTDRQQPAVTARVVLTVAGSIHDPKGKPGVAAMTADLLSQGTAKRSAQQIAEAIDFVGGSLSASADEDGTYATVTVVKKDFDLGMDLLSDILLNPAFKQAEMDRRLQQSLAGLRVQYNDSSAVASVLFSRKIYGAHPYGLPGEGTPDSLPKISRDDLVAFRNEHFAPNQALLAFAGDITPEAAFAAAEKYFGASAWPKKDLNFTPPPAPTPAAGVRILLVDRPDAAQTQIRIGRLGIPRNSADYVPLYVTNRIFGGGFNSRLSTEVRQKKGLTYGAYSGFNSNKLAGDFLASTSTRTEATVEATRLVVDLISRMASGDVTQQELDVARDYIAGVFPIQSETGEQVAGRVLTVAQYGLPADYNDTYRERVLGITPAEVKTMAGRYFNPTNLDVVLVGNVKEFRSGIEKAFPGASIEEMRFDEVDVLASDLRKPKAPAAPAATPEAIARGKALLSAATDAAGGAAVASIRSAELTGKAQVNAPQGPISLDLKIIVALPDRLRTDLTLPFGTILEGTDGTSAWLSTPQGVQELPQEFVREHARAIALIGGWGVLQQAAAGKVDVAFAGEEEVLGQKVLALDWNSPGGPTKLYVDPASGRLIGARYMAVTLRGPAETLETWSDFRTVNGVQFPFSQSIYRNGEKEADLTFTEVKLNTDPAPSLFKKP